MKYFKNIFWHKDKNNFTVGWGWVRFTVYSHIAHIGETQPKYTMTEGIGVKKVIKIKFINKVFPVGFAEFEYSIKDFYYNLLSNFNLLFGFYLCSLFFLFSSFLKPKNTRCWAPSQSAFSIIQIIIKT